MQAVDSRTFHESIHQQGVTLVDFSAAWCPPCRTLMPILDELGREYPEQLSIVEVDCDESPEIAAEYGIMSIPTVIVFHNGDPVEKLVGLRTKRVYQSVLVQYI